MLSNRKTHLILILAMVLPILGQAQYYNLAFRNYSSMDGLSQSEVNCVFEDKDGFLWIGTGYGLTLYDGKEFKNYYNRVDDTTSIGGNFIVDIAQDKKGYLWFSIYNSGISRLNPVNKKFENYQPSRKKNGVISDKMNSLLVDNYDKVWASSPEGLSIYDGKTASFYNISSIIPGEKFSINCMEKDATGRIWLGTANKIFYSDGDVRQIREVKKNLALNGINSFQFDNRNSGWLATDEGLFNFELTGQDSITLVRPAFFKDRKRVKDIEFDGDGNLWIGMRTEGLAIYFPKTGFFDQLREDYSSSRGLMSNRITDLYYDNSGGMWISGENGLQSFHNAAQKFNIYPGLSNVSDMIRGSTIYGLYVENDLFLLATSGGVIAYNRLNSHYLPIDIRHELKNASIRFRNVQKEENDKWWVTSDHGLFELVRNGKGFILQRPSSLKDPVFRTRSFRNYLKTGNSYWFATTDDGVIRYDKFKGIQEWLKHDERNTLSIPDAIINKITYDRDGNLMVGHDYGLSILYKGARNFESYIYGEGLGKGLSNKQVYDMFDDGDKIWIATFGGGMNILDKKTKKITYLTKNNGLCDDAVYNIMPENDSILWLATNKGLSRLDTRSLSFRNYEKNDGMPSEEFNMLSAYKNSKGEIFMGCVAGAISFHPDNLAKNTLLPGVTLTRIRRSGAYLDDSTTAVINRDRKIETKFGEDLFLEFSPMTFYGVSEPELTYRILELGQEWKVGEAGGLLPLVKYEPGDYTIEIRMKNYAGSESSKSWTLSYTVLPPIWKTLGFRISLIFVLMLLSYLAVRAYISRRLERQRVMFLRQQAVEQERSRISAELHDDIGGGLTAIRLLSEMSLEQESNIATSRYLQKISSSSNELIQKMNEIVWALNINNDNLQSLIAYTRQYAVSYMDDLNIACHFDTPQNIPEVTVNGKNRRSVFLLVKESLNNVVKHAQCSQVDVRIDIDDSLHIEIADNGKGFQKDKTGRGNGLNNMRKRVQAMKGQMDILNGNGTTIVFDIPVRNLNA
ncbi:MAG TPA: two-component regulator propeller domain-containing protein [Chitinophagaceae bacterium]|nr:two-component regulator propeller domain-containing protein [Chitinophagaceae bacterium]